MPKNKGPLFPPTPLHPRYPSIIKTRLFLAKLKKVRRVVFAIDLFV